MRPSEQTSQSKATYQLAPAQNRYLARAIDVFSAVHRNQHAATVGPYATVFFDDGVDYSFELSACMNLHCILSDLRRRLFADRPPRCVVIFLPGILDTEAKAADCTVYVEVIDHFPGLVLSTRMHDVQRACSSGCGGVKMEVSSNSVRLPQDLLQRTITANRNGIDPDEPIIKPGEVPVILSGLDCTCHGGVAN